MENKKQPVPEYYFSKSEWDRLGCGPLPPERDKDLRPQKKTNISDVIARGNPKTDGNIIKGYD